MTPQHRLPVGGLWVNGGMANLYTKSGKPLTSQGSSLYSRSGKYTGGISGNRAYGAKGRHLASIVGNRVVHRSTDSASMSGAHAARANTAGSASA
jgi:hypothetical protein